MGLKVVWYDLVTNNKRKSHISVSYFKLYPPKEITAITKARRLLYFLLPNDSVHQ